MTNPETGWVKLWRSVLDAPWINDPIVVAVFFQLLIRVNREEKRAYGHTIHKGAMLTSRIRIAEWAGVTEKQARRALDVLKRAETIDAEGAGSGQLISLRNWDEYQGSEPRKGRATADDRAGKGQTQGRERATTIEGKEVGEGGEGENVAKRLEAFRTRVREVHEKQRILSNAEVHRFFQYWTERGEKAKKHRWEFEKTFDIALRMHNWASRVRPTNTPANGRPGTKPSATEHLKQQIANGRFGDEARAAVSGTAHAPEDPFAAVADPSNPAIGDGGAFTS